MTYTIRRIGIKSAAKVAFVCLTVVTIPMIPAFVSVRTTSTLGFGEPPPDQSLALLIAALAVPLFYGIFAALGGAVLALIYNLGLRFHGGIKLDIELMESSNTAEKRKD